MFDTVLHTPLVLAYAFMALPVIILGFLLLNVVHKIYCLSSVCASSGTTRKTHGAFLKSELRSMKKNLPLIDSQLRRSKTG